MKTMILIFNTGGNIKIMFIQLYFISAELFGLSISGNIAQKYSDMAEVIT